MDKWAPSFKEPHRIISEVPVFLFLSFIYFRRQTRTVRSSSCRYGVMSSSTFSFSQWSLFPLAHQPSVIFVPTLFLPGPTTVHLRPRLAANSSPCCSVPCPPPLPSRTSYTQIPIHPPTRALISSTCSIENMRE